MNGLYKGSKDQQEVKYRYERSLQGIKRPIRDEKSVRMVFIRDQKTNLMWKTRMNGLNKRSKDQPEKKNQ